MTRTEPEAAALDALAAYGPFFTCATHVPGRRDDAWRSMAELVVDPSALQARIRSVREHLAAAAGRPPEAVEERVAASVAHLGLVARVVSPLFAYIALHGAPSVPALREVRWRPLLGGAFPLSLPLGTLADSGAPAREAAVLALDGLIVPLTEAFAELSLSSRTLWGNVASAVNGACVALSAAVPAEAEGIDRTARVFLGLDRLRGTYETAVDGRPFRRRNCCLIHRAVPGTGRAAAICGDCVLGGR